MLLDPGDRGADRVVIGDRAAGHAGHRDVVDEAGGVLQHARQTLVVGGRCRQADEADAGSQRRQAEFFVFLRRQVDDDQPVDPGNTGVLEEGVDAIGPDRVVVAHQHDRRVVSGLAEGRDHGERLLQGLAGLEGALAGELDRHAVRHRIGEGHTELDDVGAGRRQGVQDRAAGVEIRVAGGDIGHQRGTARRGAGGKAGLDAGLSSLGHAGAVSMAAPGWREGADACRIRRSWRRAPPATCATPSDGNAPRSRNSSRLRNRCHATGSPAGRAHGAAPAPPSRP